MEFTETYKIVSRSIVAIAIKPLPNQPPQAVPTIIGTGFVVDEGLIATNDHVIRQAERLQALPGLADGEWPVIAVLFYLLQDHGMCQIPMEIIGAFTCDVFKAHGHYYGPQQPDLGFFHVKMEGLHPLEAAADLQQIEPGLRVATAGFPMGTDALRAPGYIHQLTPTLQEGIVSAVLPFPCKSPHALLLNVMSQGGASGSPIFLPDSPAVVGVLYGGLEEKYVAQVQGVRVPYNVPTNFTFCVPVHLLREALNDIRSQPDFRIPEDSPRLRDALERVRDFSLESQTKQNDREPGK